MASRASTLTLIDSSASQVNYGWRAWAPWLAGGGETID